MTGTELHLGNSLAEGLATPRVALACWTGGGRKALHRCGCAGAVHVRLGRHLIEDEVCTGSVCVHLVAAKSLATAATLDNCCSAADQKRAEYSFTRSKLAATHICKPMHQSAASGSQAADDLKHLEAPHGPMSAFLCSSSSLIMSCISSSD